MDKRQQSRMESAMKALGVRKTWLRGPNRRITSTKRFDTMTTLSDPVDYFAKAYETELEHGSVNHSTDVTHDDFMKTCKIVAAHIRGVENGKVSRKWRRFPSYYDWLWYMEENGQVQL